MASSKTLLESAHFSTALIHGDHELIEGGNSSVAPDLSLSTIWRHVEYEGEHPMIDTLTDMQHPKSHVYSRYTTPVASRVEAVLSQITNGHAITYRSGLSAAYAAVIHYQPKRIAIRGGYHGVHSILEIHKRSVPTLEIIDIDDELKQGDVLWLESPLNPTGESRDLQYYADKAHKAGVPVLVDSTFSPPPLAEPFLWGVDCILHSASKYLGGHSDLLAGVLVVKTAEEWRELWHDRTYLGSMLGSLESYLLLRSLRTLKVRVLAQSATATALVKWLDQLSHTPEGQEFDGAPGGIIIKTTHSSLQTEEFVAKQNSGGHNPCFSILTSKADYAKALPFKLKLFTAATSLGGVESLIEQRLVSDPGADPTLVRVSVGLEDVEDLKADFRQALQYLL